MKRFSLFVSGSGSVIECAYNFLRLFPDEVEVPLVISDSESCTAIGKLKRYGVNIRSFSGWKNEREQVCDEIRNLCLQNDIDYILLGFNKVLAGNILETYHNRMVNIHLSLLPAFKGLHGVDDAVASGCRFIGGTTHFIDENLDEGLIIAQGLVPFDDRNEKCRIRNSHYEMMKRLVVNTLFGILKDRIVVHNGRVIMEGANYDGMPVNPCFDDPIVDKFLDEYEK